MLGQRGVAHYKDGMTERRQKTCACGYTKSHDMVVEEPEYTLWGWILLSIFGITPKPDHIVYRCQICRQSLGATRDPKVLARRTQPQAAPRKDEQPPKET